jgi:hypothetical protein
MILNEKSFILYAAKYYDMKKSSGMDEFIDDIKRFQYLKRLFKRYEDESDLKTRLILNHIIILYNCFGVYTTNMLFFKLKDHHKYLKPFVLFLNYMPDVIEYDNIRIHSDDIPLDNNVIKELRKI